MTASPCASAKVRFWSENFFTMRPDLLSSEASKPRIVKRGSASMKARN